MKKKCYLIENDIICGGGAEQVMKDLVEKLLREGHTVTVATRIGSRAEFYRIFPKTVKYYVLEFPWRDELKRFTPGWAFQRLRHMLFCIQRLLLEWKQFDVAVAMKEGPCMKDISQRRAVKRYGWVHVDYRYLYWTRFTFSAEDEVKCFQKMDQVFCVSQAAANGVKETIGDPGNLVVCYNPIDAERIKSRAVENCGSEYNLKKPLFVSVGRLASEKQYPMLLNVCKRLSEAYDFELWIIGDGPERERLESMLEKNHIMCVHLLGKKENPHPYLKQADCFVSVSLAESYGLAVQEALILGIPVLVTDCPAMHETVPKELGMIVDNNEESLYQGMLEILQKPDILTKYRENILAGYETDKLYDGRLEAIYRILEGYGS